MVETISPVVYGTRTRWAGAVALHAAGARGDRGRSSGPRSPAPAPCWAPRGVEPARSSLAGAAVLYVVRELTGVRIPIPQLRRQVPDWWRTYFGRPLGGVPLRRRARGRFPHVPRSRHARRRDGRRARHRQADPRRARHGAVRARERAGSARGRSIDRARGRRASRRPTELDVGTPPIRAERGRAGGGGGRGRRHGVADGGWLGPGGGRDPGGVVRLGRRVEAGRMGSVAPHALGARAPAEHRAARRVGRAGRGVPRADPHGPRARAGRGRRRARLAHRVLVAPWCGSRCATASASRAAASDAPRSTFGWRWLGTSSCRGSRSCPGRSPPRMPRSRFRKRATRCRRSSLPGRWPSRRSRPGEPPRGWEGAGREAVAAPARLRAVRGGARHRRRDGSRRRRAPRRLLGSERRPRQARRARGAFAHAPGPPVWTVLTYPRVDDRGYLGPRVHHGHARHGGRHVRRATTSSFARRGRRSWVRSGEPGTSGPTPTSAPCPSSGSPRGAPRPRWACSA